MRKTISQRSQRTPIEVDDAHGLLKDHLLKCGIPFFDLHFASLFSHNIVPVVFICRNSTLDARFFRGMKYVSTKWMVRKMSKVEWNGSKGWTGLAQLFTSVGKDDLGI